MTIEQVGIGAAPGDNTGDGLRTAMGKVNNNFSNTSHAASKLTGTAPEEVPLNSDLGDSSTRNTGTATGEIPDADDLSMVGALVNYTDNNLNPNESLGNTFDRLVSGIAVSTTIAQFRMPTSGTGIPDSITLVGGFSVSRVNDTIVGGGASVTPVMSARSSSGLTVLEVTGLTGLTTDETLNLDSTSTGSSVKVNY